MSLSAARKRIGVFLATTGLALATGMIGVTLAPQEAAAVPGPTVTTAPLHCSGDGTDGNRVQFVYTYEPGHDRFADRQAIIRQAAWEAQQNVNDSARQQGGQRWLRFHTTETGCQLVIDRVELPAGTSTPGNDDIFARLRDNGYTREDRIYVVYSEEHAVNCAGADAGHGADERPVPDNLYNTRTKWVNFSVRCFDGHSVTHELAHTLGGIQNGGPHKDDGNHCTDGFETLCQPQTGPYACPDPLNTRLLDCGHDDYFAVDPQGSYLPTHFNAARDSLYLEAGEDVEPLTSVPPLPPHLAQAFDIQSTSIAFSFRRPGWSLSYPPRPDLRYELLVNGTPVASATEAEQGTVLRATGLTPRTPYTFTMRSVFEDGGVPRYSVTSGKFTTSLAGSGSAVVAGDIVDGRRYVLTRTTRDTGEGLAITNAGSLEDDAEIVHASRTGEDAQVWQVTAAGNGNVTLRNMLSGKCLSTKGLSGVSRTPVVQATCTGATPQLWAVQSLGTGANQLRSAMQPRLCVVAEDGAAAPGTRLVLNKCGAADPTQRWIAIGSA